MIIFLVMEKLLVQWKWPRTFKMFLLQNGLLLRRYTYLSNESSYSVSQEDGVDVRISDSNSDDDESMKSMEALLYNSDASDFDPNGSYKVQSYSFEAQVNID